MLKYMVVVLLVISGTALGASRQRRSEKENCDCVPQHKCEIPGETSPSDTLKNSTEHLNITLPLIDIREGENDCESYLEKCCPPGSQSPSPKSSFYWKGCGHRRPSGFEFRILGSNGESQYAEFPWVVAILDDANKDNYKCAGSLIHPNVILTGAHCVSGKDISTLKFRAGEWDTQTTNEPLPHQERTATKIIIHEGFSLTNYLKNDFALVILSDPFDLADNVNTVCLPTQNANIDGTHCVVAGWGKNVFGKEGVYQAIMKKIEVPAVPHDKCETSLQNTRLGKTFSLDKSFMCAGGEAGKDACKGDGGAPLVYASKNEATRYEQAGIVAWGIGCGEIGVPGVYANVAHVRDWIDNQMESMEFNIVYYTDSKSDTGRNPNVKEMLQ